MAAGLGYGNVYYWRSIYHKEVNEAYFELEKWMKLWPELYKFSENDVAKNFGQNKYNTGYDDDTGNPLLDDLPEPSIFEGHELESQSI